MDSQQQKESLFQSLNLLVTAKSDGSNHGQELNGGAAVILDLFGNEREVMSKMTAVERNCLCGISQSPCSSSGLQSKHFMNADYVAVSTPDRTVISTFDFQKSQRIAQSHTQEIVTSLTSDNSGLYLCSGSKAGSCSVWDVLNGELLASPRLHYHAITKLYITSDNNFLISASRDGMLKVWFLSNILDNYGEDLSPFRTNSNHTSWITDFFVFHSYNDFRIFSCSLDLTVVLFDAMESKLLLRIEAQYPLECLCSSYANDCLIVGSSTGMINFYDFSNPLAIQSLETGQSKCESLSAHSSSIVSLVFLPDNVTLVSASLDGHLKFWNVFLKQLIREVVPFRGLPLSNCALFRRNLRSSASHSDVQPIATLKKYSQAKSQSIPLVGPVHLHPQL